MGAIGAGALWTGAVTVVLLRGLLQPLPAPVAAAAAAEADRVSALAHLATWRDLGAGLGPLVAGILLPILPPWLLYGAAGFGIGRHIGRPVVVAAPPVKWLRSAVEPAISPGRLA